jgi:hypothetical protein
MSRGDFLDRRTGFAGYTGGLRGVGGKTKMRRTGQRGGNGEEINHGAFEEGLDRIGAERRKTAAGSPKGERSESINRIFRIIGKSIRF